MKERFKGILIKESLTDPEILDTLEIVSIHSEADQDNAAETWHLYTVMIAKEEIPKVQQYLKREGGWYAHFWKDNDMTVVFRDRMFEIHRNDKTTWKDAIEYGLSVGVPLEQLDFLVG